MLLHPLPVSRARFFTGISCVLKQDETRLRAGINHHCTLLQHSYADLLLLSFCPNVSSGRKQLWAHRLGVASFQEYKKLLSFTHTKWSGWKREVLQSLPPFRPPISFLPSFMERQKSSVLVLLQELRWIQCFAKSHICVRVICRHYC